MQGGKFPYLSAVLRGKFAYSARCDAWNFAGRFRALRLIIDAFDRAFASRLATRALPTSL
jgi:hypothetical protein